MVHTGHMAGLCGSGPIAVLRWLALLQCCLQGQTAKSMVCCCRSQLVEVDALRQLDECAQQLQRLTFFKCVPYTVLSGLALCPMLCCIECIRCAQKLYSCRWMSRTTEKLVQGE